MTREEAIKHFESYIGNECYTQKHQDACRIAIAALGQEEPIKLSRNRWAGCKYCKADREGYSSCFRDINGRSRNMYIPEGEAAIVVPGKYNHKAYIKIAYCPFCGRSLTEDARAELGSALSKTSHQEPDPPLTLEELREMDGEIVYVTPLNDWAKIVKYGMIYFGTSDHHTWDEGIGKTYGKTWLAYRRKPEEGAT